MKGGSFELEIASALGKWITQGKRDDIFRRSSSSGARFTQRRKGGKDTAYSASDITFQDPLGEPLIANWSIEVKTGYGDRKKVKDADGNVIKIPVKSNMGKNKGEVIKHIDKVEIVRWDVLDFIDSKQKEPVLQKMWAQCKRDAELTNRQPILIFRRNGRSSCIMITCWYCDNLANWFNYPSCNSASVLFGLNKCICMSLQDFFTWIPDISISFSKKF